MNPENSTIDDLKTPNNYNPDAILNRYREQITAGLSRDLNLTDDPVDRLRSRARDASREQRLEIIYACLARTSETEVVEFLAEKLEETTDRQVAGLCILGLGQSNSDLAFQKILDFLEDPAYPEWLIPAINLIEQFDPAKETIPILVDLLTVDREKVKFHSAMALARIYKEHDEKFIGQLGTLFSDGCDPLTKYYGMLVLKKSPSKKAIPLLGNLIEENEDSIPCFAIEILGEIGGKKAERLIVPELESDDPIRVFYAAEALGKIDDDRHWDRLEELGRSHTDSNVRYYSLRSLFRIEADRSVNILLDSLQDDDQKIRDFASRSLRQCGETIRSRYREALGSGDREAVNEALNVLGEVGGEEVLEDLLEKVKGADQVVSQKAIEALQKLAAEREEVRRLLMEQLPVSETHLKINIMRILEGHGDSELCSYLSKYVTADDPKLRYHLVGVFRNGSNPECVYLLGRLCQDENLSVASHAVQTLTSIRNSESRKVVRDRLAAEGRPLVLISYLRGIYLDRDSNFESAVVEILRDTTDRRVKYFAACALKSIQPARFRHIMENDPYLEKVLDRIRVN